MLLEILTRLVNRDSARTEADIQADVRQYLLEAPFELHEHEVANILLESPLGDRRRIDVELGSTVIEVKRDLRRERVREDAIEQLAGYVQTRRAQTGLRYVGVLTDGVDWQCFDLIENSLRLVSQHEAQASQEGAERLTVWLEGVLATAQGIPATPREIAARLGAGSSAYALDRASLMSLYQQHKELPTTRMKRELWSRLLTSALGTQFLNTDELFVEHTLLVNSSEIIAHAVLGLQVEHIAPQSLLSGTTFDQSGIYGVVESDFFDWVIEVPGGEQFVRSLARRLARFDWSNVQQDILKTLYESIIGSNTRKKLGEYYTPDWLAEAIVEETLPDPLNTRVLDPACGSGTFLFHAVRKYIDAAEQAGTPLQDILRTLPNHVIGMDLHPVAVTLARVTYLLAIGRDRLTSPERGNIQVPVYLGDSIQWREQELDLWTAGQLVIHADDSRELFAADLRFPDELLENALNFDRLVNEMALRASQKPQNAPVPSLGGVFQRFGVQEQHRATLQATFATMCRLHDEGRDHIWGYYVRNLARPMWLSRPENRVDVLVGNPPWLAYRKMTRAMQAVFRRMSEQRGLWHGAEIATQQDLSALFVVRATELYLRPGGRLAMVLPNTAIDREHYRGFRSGDYHDPHAPVFIEFSEPWDLRRLRPHFFPRGSSVVFGRRSDDAREMPVQAEVWEGALGRDASTWAMVQERVTRNRAEIQRVDGSRRSPYAARFAQGATLTPRAFFVVNERPSGPLGLPAGRRSIVSSRSIQENEPWCDLPDMEGVVEAEFIRPILSGENLFPYRTHESSLAVLPCGPNGMLSNEAVEVYSGLHEWWHHAWEQWQAHRVSERLTLAERLDYQRSLSRQFPIADQRVLYNRAGMHLVAAKTANRRALIANGLYWATAHSNDEADYLCAVMNSAVTTERLRPFMSYGKDERDIHKHVWNLPIPQFDNGEPSHLRLAALARQAEVAAQGFQVSPDLHFSATRRQIRDLIEESCVGQEITSLVRDLLAA